VTVYMITLAGWKKSETTLEGTTELNWVAKKAMEIVKVLQRAPWMGFVKELVMGCVTVLPKEFAMVLLMEFVTVLLKEYAKVLLMEFVTVLRMELLKDHVRAKLMENETEDKKVVMRVICLGFLT